MILQIKRLMAQEQKFQKKRQIIKISLVLLIITLTALSSPAYTFTTDNWEWKHLKSEHFILSYNENTSDIAEKALNYAEQTAKNIEKYFGPDISKRKIAIVLKDHNDYSNGAAYKFSPLVVIECRKTQFLWRGETNWLKNVIAHELSHIYSRRIMNLPIKIFFGYSRFAESDNIEGSGLIDVEDNRMPIWFIEGIAQQGSNEMKADFRDPFREMLLRDAWQNNRLLSLSEMNRFEGSSREYELAYNQGFDLVLYLQSLRPENIYEELCPMIAQNGFEDAVYLYFDEKIETIHERWKESLAKRFKDNIKEVHGLQMYQDIQSETRILDTQIASAAEGRYLISNSRHDYNRFDLARPSIDRENDLVLAEDVGQVLREDKVTGEIWFNKNVYNYQAGVSNYEIFKMDASETIQQITKGKRCMAFGVKNNHLIYASYSNGSTEIISKNTKEKEEKILITFPYETAVYNISVISPDNAVLTLGRGKNIYAAFLRENKLETIWENLKSDTLDVTYAENDRLLFVSTEDGNPQLYWCDLNIDKYFWYKLTDVSGGVRYPGVEADGKTINCSIFQDGHFKIYTLNSAFNDDELIFPQRYSNFETRTEEDEVQAVEISNNVFNLIAQTPMFSLILSDDRYIEESGTVSSRIITGSTALVLQNAPGNFAVGTQLNLDYPVSFNTYDTSKFSHLTWLNFKFWQLNFKEQIAQFYSTTEYDESVNDRGVLIKIGQMLEIKQLKSEISYQLFKDDIIKISYQNRTIDRERMAKIITPGFVFSPTGTPELKNSLGTVYKGNLYSAQWEHFSYQSKFSPAHLGYPYLQYGLKADLYDNTYPNFTSDPGAPYSPEDSTVSKLNYKANKRSLFFDNKLSINLGISGFSYSGGIKSGKISRFMYESIGREHLFTGYSTGIRVRKMNRISCDMRFNPAITLNKKTYKSERMNAGLKIEAGEIDYHYNDKINSATPVSVEASIRYYFYYWPAQQSHAYLKFALPLTDIDNTREYSSSKIYFGITL
jgi:hypothetical protein